VILFQSWFPSNCPLSTIDSQLSKANLKDQDHWGDTSQTFVIIRETSLYTRILKDKLAFRIISFNLTRKLCLVSLWSRSSYRPHHFGNRNAKISDQMSKLI